MDRLKAKAKRRLRRRRHIRKRVIGTKERPRLSVFKSHKHIYCQVIDDNIGKTLCAASTLTKEIRKEILEQKKASGEKKFTKTDAAALVGRHIAHLMKEKGIEKVCFDRGGYKFHGRVKSLAEAARKEGIQF
ncbi:MAG: 50S ribosomal protein L18 [Planctomycetota bacterium]|nr:MAG: 50S ribosomal protein L18 [Planctomycetota bacterium]